MAAANPVDVLISDLGLPDGDAGQTMKEVSLGYDAIGIALSGYGMEEDMRRSREYGFLHHLVKPVEVGRLDAILRGIASISGQPKKSNRVKN